MGLPVVAGPARDLAGKIVEKDRGQGREGEQAEDHRGIVSDRGAPAGGTDADVLEQRAALAPGSARQPNGIDVRAHEGSPSPSARRPPVSPG